MRPIIILAATLSLAACDLADRAEGKSPSREHIERLAALEAGMSRIEAKMGQAVVPAPVAVAPAPAAPVFSKEPAAVVPTPTPVEPVCVPVFRVTTCP